MRREISYPLLCLVSLFVTLASGEAQAWVDLEKWKKPKVFDQAPSTEIIQTGYKSYLRKPKNSALRLTKTSGNLVGLYPLLDNLVAGVIVGAGAASVQDIQTESGLRSFQNSQLSVELAGQYAFSNEHSLFISSGMGFKELESKGKSTSESRMLLTTYSVWSLNDDVGLGIGLAGNHNTRKSTFVPLLGGSWQPSPELRVDGWLPSHVHTRWKYAPAQSLFLRLELSGESGYAKNFLGNNDADITLLGAQMILGWSLGMPIGIATGFLRIDPSFGFFAGNTSVENLFSGSKTKQKLGSVPVADIRVAVVF
jgi:hypothetical protein